MNKNPRLTRSSAGFTLVELLVVIVIIAALAGISFSAASKMKKSGQATKALQNMRQVGTIVAVYTSENSDSLPPIRSDIQDADGSWRSGEDWPWIVLTTLYPDVEKATIETTAWWKANSPMMYNPLIVNNLKTKKFKAAKNGHGMNQVIAGEIYGWSGGWVPGDGGYQTQKVPISRIARPSRTLLFTSSPDYHFSSGMTKKPEFKPLAVDGKIPAYFVDGHAETVVVRNYIKANYDYVGD